MSRRDCSGEDCPGRSPVVRGGAIAASTEEWELSGRLGEYQLIAQLGEGGMGRVYKARHTRLDRIVALKVLPRGRIADPRAVARFEREMKAVGRLDHPNIVQAYDAREIDGTPVLVMEFVDGLDLARNRPPHRAAAGRRRLRDWSARRPWGCNAPTSTGWCIATSSRRTSCSTRAGRRSRCSTSAWPGSGADGQPPAERK